MRMFILWLIIMFIICLSAYPFIDYFTSRNIDKYSFSYLKDLDRRIIYNISAYFQYGKWIRTESSSSRKVCNESLIRIGE